MTADKFRILILKIFQLNLKKIRPLTFLICYATLSLIPLVNFLTEKGDNLETSFTS